MTQLRPVVNPGGMESFHGEEGVRGIALYDEDFDLPFERLTQVYTNTRETTRVFSTGPALDMLDRPRQETSLIYVNSRSFLLEKGDIPMSDNLSFSARDLLTRLVREDGAIRGKITNLAEPLWFHRGTCPDIAAQIEDVRELLQNGLIEFWKDSIQFGEELYRASAKGLERAGKRAVADAARSAAHYD